MSSLTFYQCLHCFSTPMFLYGRRPELFSSLIVTPFPEKFKVLRLSHDNKDSLFSFQYNCKSSDEIGIVESPEKVERPTFDINLAVILAGFAFEAYWSPSEDVGEYEVDAADCKTVYLSRAFIHEVYDGKLVVKVIKGYDFPAMDPWGTSDPYVVLQLDGQVVKSSVKWGKKSPIWDEELTLNIKRPPSGKLEIAVWDANLVTPHKRMGNARVCLDLLCDGNLHDVLLELEGIGGGGKIKLEVKYKGYDENEVKKWWKVPFVGEFFRRYGLESVLKTIVGSETVQARQFAEYAFGQLKTFNEEYFFKNRFSFGDNTVVKNSSTPVYKSSPGASLNDSSCYKSRESSNSGNGITESSPALSQVAEIGQSEHFWKNLADAVNQNIVQKFGVPVTEKIKWEGFDLLNKIGSQSRKIADEVYIGSGLASPSYHSSRCDDDATSISGSVSIDRFQYLLPDIKKATNDILRQTDSILGALMVLTPVVPGTNMKAQVLAKGKTAQDSSTSVNSDVSEYVDKEKQASSTVGSELSEQKSKEMKALFTTAESAMEAWAMLAASLGHPTFIKSEFEKLCFLDNPSTDTQVAVWRDSARKRLVVAFRGTEQARWKDLRTDLMLAPAGLNPERIGGEFKQEIQVHSGFLSAYDSVRTRLMPLIKSSIGFINDNVDLLSKWHVYVTGHSLGGALSTLLALELSSSELVKRGVICVTMYNFGSPRVGNKWFAELYNEKVLDSWRVINHRDIIPTIPRLMGYCHVAHPIYLSAENESVLENMALLKDGYEGDVIGESTPDAIVTEFMKGEKELIEKLLHTEINIFRSIRDGTALMQHMEDFYYISLLESVRLSYKITTKPKNNEDSTTI